MKRQANVSRWGRAPRFSQTAHPGAPQSYGRNEVGDRASTLRGKTLLALTAAAVVLLGCQQDADRGPGAIEPSAGSPQSERRDDTSPSGGPSGVTGSESVAPAVGAGGEDDEGAASGGAGAAGSTTSGPSGAGTGGTSGDGTSGAGTGSGGSGGAS